MYRSLPFCNRPDSIGLLGFLTVSPLWCMTYGGFLAMSTVELDEKLNRQPPRFPNTGAMTVEVAHLAIVRGAVASSILGRARALVLSGFLTCAGAAQADKVDTSADADADASGNSEISSSNAANNPAEPKFTLQYWNYYAPSLNNSNGDAENGEARVLVPFKIAGIQQIVHIDPPIVTNPTATGGPRTGLGDTQIYNFTLGKIDVGLPQKVTLGLGPLVAIPTSA